MQIKFKFQISGTRDGVDWPAPGETLDVSADEAKSLISGGLAVEHKEEFAIAELPDGTVLGDGTSIVTLSGELDGTEGALPEHVDGDNTEKTAEAVEPVVQPEPVVETATAPEPETATKTRAPRAPKGK